LENQNPPFFETKNEIKTRLFGIKTRLSLSESKPTFFCPGMVRQESWCGTTGKAGFDLEENKKGGV